MPVMQVSLGGGGRVLESDPNNEPGCLSLDTVAWQPGSVYDVTVRARPRGHNTALTARPTSTTFCAHVEGICSRDEYKVSLELTYDRFVTVSNNHSTSVWTSHACAAGHRSATPTTWQRSYPCRSSGRQSSRPLSRRPHMYFPSCPRALLFSLTDRSLAEQRC